MALPKLKENLGRCLLVCADRRVHSAARRVEGLIWTVVVAYLRRGGTERGCANHRRRGGPRRPPRRSNQSDSHRPLT
jgi:hypothetical protein